MKNVQEMSTLIKCAYKKLKAYSYHESRNIFLKKKILDFENQIIDSNKLEYDSIKLCSRMNELFNNIDESIKRKDAIEFKMILNSPKVYDEENISYFNIRVVPKRIKRDNETTNTISNFEEEKETVVVDKVMHYIDLDISSQIIGTLWVMAIGKELENEYKDYAVANLLEDGIDVHNLKLFKPYYLSYEKWRDDAINIVEERMNKGYRSTMITLDLKEYYYSIDLNLEKIQQDIYNIYKKKDKKEQLVSLENFEYINEYVFKVIKSYSDEMRIKKINKEENKMILPIGFLPSNILSNYYLKEFDENLVKKVKPIYYKRYVDDILIVIDTSYKKEKVVEENQLLLEYFQENNIFKTNILFKNNQNEYVIKEVSNRKNFIELLKEIDIEDIKLKKDICDKFKVKNKKVYLSDWKKGSIEVLQESINSRNENEFLSIIASLDFDSLYMKKIYLIQNVGEVDYSNLCIQDEKIRVYDFISRGSRALLENFKSELKKNSSAFKFLPQKDEVIEEFDKEVYQISYKDSIHKLSSINDFKINRYNLSKFLARVIYSDKLENNLYINDVDEKIKWIFEGKSSIEFFFLWEKIFNFYLMNKKYNSIISLYLIIVKVIEKIQFSSAKFNTNTVDIKISSDDKFKSDLVEYLEFSLFANCALDDNLFEAIKIKKDEIFDNKSIYIQKEKLRVSNMLNHSLVRNPLFNYYYINFKTLIGNLDYKFNFVTSNIGEPETLSDKSRCFCFNEKYTECLLGDKVIDKKIKEKVKIESFSCLYNPRFVHLHECIIDSINLLVLKESIISECKEIKNAKEIFERLNNLSNQTSKYKENDFRIIENFSGGIYNRNKASSEKISNTHLKYLNINDYLFTQKHSIVNYIDATPNLKKDKLKIGIINMKINDIDLVGSFKKQPNIESERLSRIFGLLNEAIKKGAEMIVFPEVSIPFEWLSVVADFSRKHDVVVIFGIEHVIYNNCFCCNYIATILPGKYQDYTYSLIKLRLKNHYSPNEKEWTSGYGWKLPHNKDWKKEYDLFRWKGIDFSTFSCFELANIQDRALFTSFVDLIVGSVHNKDINYYSNVIESLARDVHCYFVQVNESSLGDSRIVKPSSTNTKNLLQISGGINDTVLVEEIDIKKLRDFQIKKHNLQVNDKEFKPVPPQFNHENVKIRDGLLL